MSASAGGGGAVASGFVARARSFMSVGLTSQAIASVRTAATRHRFNLYSRYTSKAEKWIYINSALTELGRDSTGNKITPYYDSADSYVAMWAAVDAAVHSVRWHTYICKDDVVGKKTMEKLLDAKKRGCEVELLYDSGGNMSGRKKMMMPLIEQGIRVIEYRPFFSQIQMYFKNGMHWHLSPGIRNHRKVLVCDNQVAFLGGLNIGDDYAGTQVGGNGRFRDTQCKIEGPTVRHMVGVLKDTIATAQPIEDKVELHKYRGSGESARKLRTEAAADAQQAAASRDHDQDQGTSTPKVSGAQHFPPSASATTNAQWRSTANRGSGSSYSKEKDQRKLLNHTMTNLMPRPAGAPTAFNRWRHWARRAFRFRARVVTGSPRPVRRLHPRIRQTLALRGRLRDSAIRNRLSDALKTSGITERRAKLKKVQENLRLRVEQKLQRSAKYLEGDESSKARMPAAIVAQLVAITSRRVRERRWAGRRRRDASATHTMSDLKDGSGGKTQGGVSQKYTQQQQQPQQGLALADTGHAQVLLCNPHSRDWSLQMAFWLVVRKAHNRVWITTPYFLPNRKLMNAVTTAAQRGIDVRLMVGSSGTSDPWFMWYVGQWVTHRLLSAGVKVYEYTEEGRVLHAKTVVVDGTWSSIGSYNWDVLSNKLLEASISSFDANLAVEMERHFERDMALSRQLTDDAFQQRLVWYRRIFCWFAFHLVKLSERVSFWTYSDPDLTSKID